MQSPMTIAIATLACIGAVSAVSVSVDSTALFADFKVTYQKSYGSAKEEAMRLAIFNNNVQTAAQMTAATNGVTQFGVTKFSDLTSDEFRSQYLNYKPSQRVFPTTEVNVEGLGVAADQVNWAGNLTTPVKDQGQCGSCWAFSATEQIESMAIRAGITSNTEALAVQQIVSCDRGEDEGCNGGDTPTAYEYVMRAGGLEKESVYPYKSGNNGRTGKCEKPSESDFVVTVSSHAYVSKKDEAGMAKYVSATGPLSICVDAEKWQHYKSGVLTKSACGGAELDHCVQITGYDLTETAEEGQFWWVRNSWNTDWGVRGFIKVEYGVGACGIEKEPTTVVVGKAH